MAWAQLVPAKAVRPTGDFHAEPPAHWVLAPRGRRVPRPGYVLKSLATNGIFAVAETNLSSASEQSRNWRAQARERENDRDGRQHRDDAQNQVIFGPSAGHECDDSTGGRQ